MREANDSLNVSAEPFSKAFDFSSKKIQLEHKNFIDNSVKTTIQILYDVALFNGFEKKDEVFRDFITLNARRRREIETRKKRIFHLLLN